MSDDQAICDANYARFIREVIANEKVWALTDGDNFACCESNDPEGDDGDPAQPHSEDSGDVLVFWSTRDDALKVKKTEFTEYHPETISLFEFLYTWLPNMADEGVYVGTNWTDELLGFEVLPDELQDDITAAMPDELRESYLEQLDNLPEEEDDEEDGDDT